MLRPPSTPSKELWIAFTEQLDRARPSDRQCAGLGTELDVWPAWLRLFPASWFEHVVEQGTQPWFSLAIDADVRAWAYSRAAPRAYDFEMGLCYEFEAALEKMAASPAMEHLRRIRISPVGGGELLPHAKALSAVDLGLSINAKTLRSVVDAPWAPRLQEFAATGNGRRVSAELWPALAERLRELKILRLSDMSCDVDFVRALGDNAQLQLETLQLSYSPIGGEGVLLLAEAPLRSLRELDLSCVKSGREEMELLLESEALGGLRSLVLGANNLGDAGLTTLAAAPLLRDLRELDLRYNNLTARGVSTLVASRGVAALRSLTLRNNPLGDAAALAIARSPHLGGLEHLNIREAGIGADGLRALIESEQLPSLMVINVMHNKGAALLRDELDARFERVIDLRD